MKQNLTTEEYNQIEDVVSKAISAPNKKDAQRYMEKLRFLLSGYGGSIATVLSKLYSSTQAATGNIPDKSNRQYYVQCDISSLRNFIKDE